MLKQDVSKIWLTNKISATLIIPIELARKHGLAEPSHVIVEEHPLGILIRKLDLYHEKQENKAGSSGGKTSEHGSMKTDITSCDTHVLQEDP